MSCSAVAPLVIPTHPRPVERFEQVVLLSAPTTASIVFLVVVAVFGVTAPPLRTKTAHVVRRLISGSTLVACSAGCGILGYHMLRELECSGVIADATLARSAQYGVIVAASLHAFVNLVISVRTVASGVLFAASAIDSMAGIAVVAIDVMTRRSCASCANTLSPVQVLLACLSIGTLLQRDQMPRRPSWAVPPRRTRTLFLPWRRTTLRSSSIAVAKQGQTMRSAPLRGRPSRYTQSFNVEGRDLRNVATYSP